MDSDNRKTEKQLEREIYDEIDLPVDKADEHDTEIERRRGNVEMHRVDPEAPRDRNEAIYGEAEIDPGDNDRKRDHHATDDEHV